ncbi:MAG: hypothetical protein Sv326_1097 [Candidatus Fermentimicrarchaeum limneticum]|uniref:Uncharacterized protein n=1 Tax=Fermentimicrarchaeum limneticum TaxID=2795018 RepID=A0A7D5XI90_FERL1|nr:MAG: hypothetical protein Sv326_1097 [Candidatus Fermentimicrarchaeum limneticum]
MEYYLLLVSFAFLGAGLKYIDCVYDEGVFDKRVAIALGVMCGLLGGYIIATDRTASSIGIAVVIGVAISRKIDTPVFMVATVVAFAIPIFLANSIMLNWLPIAALVFGGIIDEMGNNRADLGLINSPFWKTFFHFRFSMQVVMLLLVIAGVFEPIYFLAFFLFDLSYHMVGGYANRIIRGMYEFIVMDTPDEIIVRRVGTASNGLFNGNSEL